MSVTRRWFQPGEGIAREVITADIQRYLGNDALVKPGEDDQGVQGYWITAYRALTSQMVADLKLDSERWRYEVSQGRVSYQDSRTHQSRQHYGPSDPAPAPAPVYQQQPPRPQAYAQPQAHQQYAQEPVNYTYSQQPQSGYPPQSAGPPYSAPAYNQPGAQIRTAPSYSYGAQQPSDPRPQYQQPHQGYSPYSQSPASAPPAQQQAYQPPPQQPQPSAPNTYYASDGRQYPNPPPQPANHGRRRGL